MWLRGLTLSLVTHEQEAEHEIEHGQRQRHGERKGKGLGVVAVNELRCGNFDSCGTVSH